MSRSLLCAAAVAAGVLQGGLASAQDESRLHALLRVEGQDLHDQCIEMPTVIGCATTLLTGQPLHLTVGSIAPQNGFGVGPAFVWHETPSENWRLNGSLDGVWAPSGAWRAGAYVTVVHTAVAVPTLGAPVSTTVQPYPVLKLYTQTISLPKVSYFGIGPDTNQADQAVFGLRETIVGASGIWPIAGAIAGRLALSLTGEVNGRWMAVRSGSSDGVPSLDQQYTEATAPGLSAQPATVQFGEGARMTPSLVGGHVHLNYSVLWQQFVVPADRTFSFQRWTVDLRHDIPLYGTSSTTARESNTPNECASDPTSAACPSVSRNRSGAVTLRGLVSRSEVSGSSVVPFYFQQTLGGSDLAGNQMLASYDDYRFRGPHLVLLQETFEHSLLYMIGLQLFADQGTVESQSEALRISHLRHSEGIGLSIRGGGLPAASVSWATGGPEGRHIAFLVSPSLLGGSSRPALQ